MNTSTTCGVAGRCVRSFSVQVVNRSCAALTWTLLENCSTPQFMVVQWSSRRHQGSAHHRKLQGGDTWARLPYGDSPAYLTGNHASTLHFLQSLVAELALKDVVSPPQGKSLIPTTTSTCTPCLQTARGSRWSPQVGARSHSACFKFKYRLCSEARCLYRCSQKRRTCRLPDAADRLLPLRRPLCHPHRLAAKVRGEKDFCCNAALKMNQCLIPLKTLI